MLNTMNFDCSELVKTYKIISSDVGLNFFFLAQQS